jgi:DNA-binding response OmpR family regulator
MKILLIEPDRLLAECYKKALRADGDHQVTACAGAQAGILAADQVRPDLIILELQLVEHSGIEFLYELRSYSDWQGIPIIVQSMVPEVEFSGSGEILKNELGVQEYLYKPATKLRDLISSVNRISLLRA